MSRSSKRHLFVTATFRSIAELAQDIPGLPEDGPQRLEALRRAVGDQPAPAALGVRRRSIPHRAAAGAVVERPFSGVERLTEEQAEALPVGYRYFDREWYSRTYVDVRQSNMDPSFHFRKIGWKEGRNPNPYFDVKSYLAANPDVADAGINPFEHFIFYGITDRRRLKPV